MPAAKLTRESLSILVVGFLILFVGGGSRFAIGLVLRPMAEDLDWSRSTLGAAAAVFLMVSATCMFLSGRLADRVSLRTVLCGGLIASAVGIGAMSVVAEPWQALLFYGFLFAIGNGLASIAPVGVMVSRWFSSRAGLANAITTSGIGFGQLVIIGGLAILLADIGWRSAFFWLGAINLALIPLVFGFMVWGKVTAPKKSPATGQTKTEIGIDLKAAMGTRQFWLLVLIYGICGFQDFFVATHVVAFAQDRGVETLLAGNLLAFMGLAGVAGVILAGVWSDHGGPWRATLFCFVLRVAIFALILFDQGTISVASFALLYGTTFWLTAPLTVIFARDAFGIAHLGAISGLIVMIHHMSGGAGAFAGAWLFDSQGNYDTAFVLMLILSVAAVLFSLALRR